MRSMTWAVALGLCASALIAGAAGASSKCEDTRWSYCGKSIDKCCPPERPYACINLKSEMHGAMTRGGPLVTVPRGWSGCVGPATPVSQAAWANNCRRWTLCSQ